MPTAMKLKKSQNKMHKQSKIDSWVVRRLRATGPRVPEEDGGVPRRDGIAEVGTRNEDQDELRTELTQRMEEDETVLREDSTTEIGDPEPSNLSATQTAGKAARLTQIGRSVALEVGTESKRNVGRDLPPSPSPKPSPLAGSEKAHRSGEHRERRRATLRFLQINTDRGVAAQELLQQEMLETQIDICLVAEPNKTRGQGWYPDASGGVYGGDAAIVAQVQLQAEGEAEKGFRWVRLKGVLIYSCYISPNCKIEEFSNFLDRLEISIRRNRKGAVVIGGDFNAKHPLWGETRTDARGTLFADWIERMELVVSNIGRTPTFRRGEQKSILDVTLTDQNTARKVVGWKVLEKGTGSHHGYISFEIQGEPQQNFDIKRKGWNTKKLDMEAAEKACREAEFPVVTGSAEKAAIDLVRKLRKICDASMPRRKAAGRRKSAYWWTPEISEARTKAFHLRRYHQKACKKREEEASREEKKRNWKQAERQLKSLISESKSRCWNELLEGMEKDPWGMPYKIVMKKLGNTPIPGLQDVKRVEEIAKTLFPTGTPVDYEKYKAEVDIRSIPLFTVSELGEAAKRTRGGTAPGPDGIPNETLKMAVGHNPGMLLQTFNHCLTLQTFPESWKTARLVLLRKGDKPLEENSSYRPICLLDTVGKMLERLLANRLLKALEERGGLAKNQFGFLKGKSTMDAMEEVKKFAKNAKGKSRKSRMLCAMVTLDVKNAFNSASWEEILKALEKKKVPGYLRNMIASYLSQRKVLLEGEDEVRELEMTCGVPQGSVLGPLLWLVMYDSLLEKNTPQSRLVGFADDIVILAYGRTEEELETALEVAVTRVQKWMEEKGLQLAGQKTEAMMLVGKRAHRPIRLIVDGFQVEWKDELRYLGVWFDKSLTFVPHVKKVTEKAKKIGNRLARLMPNIGGPRPARRKLLHTVTTSVVSYAAPVWAEEATQRKGMVAELDKAQRGGVLRMISGYRTVSTIAAEVIAGTPPLDLLLTERKELWDRVKQRKAKGEETTEKWKKWETRSCRERTLKKWQDRWEAEEERGQWTKSLIPDIQEWIERPAGEIDYRTTQYLTGHGSFQAFRTRIGKSEPGELCLLCNHGGAVDDARHALFECRGSCTERETLRVAVGMDEEEGENLMRALTKDRRAWKAFQQYTNETIRKREAEERRRQKIADPAGVG